MRAGCRFDAKLHPEKHCVSVRCAALLAILLAESVLPAATPPRDPVMFYRDVAPILYRSCAPCHAPGESAPFPLLSYEDAKRHATQIAVVTKKRYMPPWLPDDSAGHFVEERKLAASEINLIQRWVAEGAVAGRQKDGPSSPNVPGEWKLGRPDLVLQVPEPYELSADGSEVFWNFIIPVPLQTTRWVKAVEIHPGNPRVVHHASIIVDRGRSARHQANVRGFGFPGMDLTIEETAFDPDGTFLAWKPGSVPAPEPPGMAWRADPGMDLIFNVHLRPSGKPETVAPTIALYFSDQPQTRFPMLVELENDSSIDVPAGDHDYVVKDDFRLPADVRVLAIYPHAHYLGKLLEAYATLPDRSRKWLIRIPAWDLNWQGVYHYREPVSLPRGSVISMRFHYDNSADNVRNPNKPPVRVKGGGRANDEMANLWLQVLPDGEGDQRPLLEEALMQQRLAKYPNDFASNFNIGDILLAKGDAAASLPYFAKAMQARPASALAATEYGVALASAQRLDEARQHFRRALELDPNFVDARFDLASVDAQSGDLQSAAENFKRVLDARPGDAKSKQHLGEVLYLLGDKLAESGDLAAAEQQYKKALFYRPGDPQLHTSLGVVLARLGRLLEARPEFDVAVRLDPKYEPARKALDAINRELHKTSK